MVLMVVVPPLGRRAVARATSARFVIAYLLGAWAMLGLGMVIASLFHNAKVAAGFGSFLFFVMQFFAGLWWQRPNMPTRGCATSPTSPPAARPCRRLTDPASATGRRLLYLIVLAVWGAVDLRGWRSATSAGSRRPSSDSSR